MKELAFDEREYRRRFDLVREECGRRGIQYLILRTPEHTCWISGFDPTGVFYQNQLHIDVRTGDVAILTHRAEEKLALVQSWVQRLLIWRHGEDPLKMAAEYASAYLGPGSVIGMNLSGYYQNVSDYHVLHGLLGHVDVVDVSQMIDDLRLRKSDAEIGVMRRAAALADAGFRTALEVIKPGVTELDVNAAIQQKLTSLGCEYPAFPTLVSSGPRTGMFHALPSSRKLEIGDPVTMEIAGVVKRYNVNIVRTVFVGRATEEGRRLYGIVRRAYEAGLAAVRPGVPVGQIDKATREVRRDYAEYIPARAGFGVELAYPPTWIGSLSILESDPHILEPGYVFSLEPSISGYRDWTIIVGSVVLVTKQGAEVLHTIPIDLIEVG
jgi:Xaa-Pro dipeptidase